MSNNGKYHKLLFVAPPATDLLELPQPKIFYCYFQNNTLFYLQQKIKIGTNLDYNDSDIADSQQTVKQYCVKQLPAFTIY